MKLDVIYAGSLQPGDVLAGVVIDSPMRPVNNFAHAWTVESVESVKRDGRTYAHIKAQGGWDLMPEPARTQVLVIRP